GQRGDAHGRGRAAHEPARLPARAFVADRSARRLRARRVRRLYRAHRRRSGALLPDVRRAGRRLCHHHHRGRDSGAGRTLALSRRFLRAAREAMRLLHPSDDPPRPRAPGRQPCPDARGHRRCNFRQYLPLHRLRANRRSDCARRRAHARLEPAGAQAMTTKSFRFVSTDRRVREDRRFVVGKGRFAADFALAGTRHVALVTCRHPAARVLAIDTAAGLAAPGVHYVRDGRELAATQPLLAGLDTPKVPRRPLAVDVARYAGEWVAAVVSETRALAEDAAELVRVDYQPLPFVLDGEAAYAPGSPIVHADHGSNVLLARTFVWGEVEKDFAESPHRLSVRVKWGRSSTVPVETFAVLASWDPWREVLDVYASVQMPRFPDQLALALKLPGSSVRVHNDVDVGGSYGVKRGIKHAVLVGYLSRRLGFPVRLVEDRLENMRGGDGHGPERNFDIEVAFDEMGLIRSMKMRALDNVGAYAGRSPFQLGKPIGAIRGPYRIQRVQYRAIAVTSNKTVQEAVRAFGQSPTNYAIERAIEEVARHRGLDRLEVRRRNLIRADEFPYLIPSGTTYDSGDYHAVVEKVVARADY